MWLCGGRCRGLRAQPAHSHDRRKSGASKGQRGGGWGQLGVGTWKIEGDMGSGDLMGPRED